MSINHEMIIRKRIKILIWFFIVALLLSGITAFPLEWELRVMVDLLPKTPSPLSDWINHVYLGVKNSNDKYPFIAYGTDWLAFAHIMIAIAFIGPLRDPVKNIWIIQFGIIACIALIPLALIAGEIRQIPMYWRLIDCSFGVFGLVPLTIILRYIRQIEPKPVVLKLHRKNQQEFLLDDFKFYDL